MIRITEMRWHLNEIKTLSVKRKPIDQIIDINSSLYMTITKHQSGKAIHGYVYLKPSKVEVGNFSLSTKLHSHPFYSYGNNSCLDYSWFQDGPQVSWIQIYPGWEKKGIGSTVYEALVNHFGILFSDYEQTFEGTGLWKRLIKNKNVNVYSVQWTKRLDKVNVISQASILDDVHWFQYKETLLVATPKK